MTQQLETLTKDQLYELAKDRDVEGRSSMDKDQLIEALEVSADGTAESENGLERPTTTKRAVWKGSITFGLITIPVGLYTAIEDRDISFHLLSADDGSRIRYKRVSSKSGEEVEWDDIVKGYEYEEGHYVTFTQEELERIPADSLRTVDVVQFTDSSQIDPLAFDRSYYVAPDSAGIKAYSLLVQALESSDRVGLGKVTIREKERMCVLRPYGSVLVLDTMNWPDEIRVPVFEEIEDPPKATEAELGMADQLIDQMTADFDPSQFSDTYRQRLEDAIEAKIQGEDIQLAAEEQPAKVTDLMEALQASVEATKKRRTA